MEEINLSHTVTGIGAILVIAGIMQLFHRSLNIGRDKRGQIYPRLSLQGWSLRSIYPGALMITAGVLLLGTGAFLGGD
jgi:hypothetical protein